MNLYGLIIGISIAIGIQYFSKNNRIIPKNRESMFLFGLLISGLFGARIYHVIDQWSYYQTHPSLIFQTWHGGLAIYGALIFTTLFIFIYSLISKISFLSILDSITPILPLCQAIGRVGNFVNKEIPTWWIEASLNLLLFFLLRKSKTPTSHYLIGYGIIRFFVEFLRSDTWQISNFKIAQIISLLCIFLGLLTLHQSRRIRN
ncbi:MAG: Prolipoprotein diacylglyceryl transferase [Candidatus Shapirobacteria bacterium GW2011_GWE1_38_10]|uniref:Prolipoprotein diacylglyceryl transferase n=1 Tax=Candidatus Shapirobacteria bacterium GW2011_GWE1_38_10 TaxID=1618488 RepID=A0A0G0KMH3_9BACT|nr:MAG: Prolipoprotein diacylglyceryl transferase [Candidatus Shapirobacteria bacterium GW2011_GWF2_37_20]KKQ50399.1 MAG: Prolipoprotein diacylglyceryl transferase [Candidatus Shapirobacteria bacterium GW2011_GWE1_38_10]